MIPGKSVIIILNDPCKFLSSDQTTLAKKCAQTSPSGIQTRFLKTGKAGMLFELVLQKELLANHSYNFGISGAFFHVVLDAQ
jgi:hypothetical protein